MVSYQVMGGGFEFRLTNPTPTLFSILPHLNEFQKQPSLSTKVAFKTFLFTTYL